MVRQRAVLEPEDRQPLALQARGAGRDEQHRVIGRKTIQLEAVVVSMESQDPEGISRAAVFPRADLANPFLAVRRADVQDRLAVRLVGSKELNPDPAPPQATPFGVRPAPTDPVVGEKEVPVRQGFQCQRPLALPGGLHPAGAQTGCAFMGLGHTMRQLRTVLVLDDRRVTALDDQDRVRGLLPALEQVRDRAVVASNDQLLRPARLRGSRRAGLALPEDPIRRVDLFVQHEEQTAGDSLDPPRLHRSVFVPDEQRHVRRIARPAVEVVAEAVGFHDQQ